MKRNISVVPALFKKSSSLALKMLRTFYKLGRARCLPKRDYSYNHLKNLALVYFKLTPACNLRCVMCGQYGDKGVMKNRITEECKKNLSLDTWKRLTDEITPQKPVIYVWGGEPFLYPYLMPLVKYIIDKGLFVTINTNGTLLEQYAEQIVKDKWSTVLVSLDAFRDVNDEIRGAGAYDKVVAGFKAINREKEKQKSKYPLLGIVTVVTNKNYMDLENLCEASKEYKLDFHIINLGTYTNDNIVAAQKKIMKEKMDVDIDCLGAYNTGYNLGIDFQKLHDILQNIHKKKLGHPIITVPALNPQKTHVYYSELETPVRNHCLVPFCQLNVNYNGDVHFCADYPDYILGNINEAPFNEIFNGEKANRFRKLLNETEDGMFPGCLRCYQNMLFGKKIKGA